MKEGTGPAFGALLRDQSPDKSFPYHALSYREQRLKDGVLHAFDSRPVAPLRMERAQQMFVPTDFIDNFNSKNLSQRTALKHWAGALTKLANKTPYVDGRKIGQCN